MSERPLHVLFLCTGNSARSILAEAVLRHLGGDRFVAHSAGSQPKSEPHPGAIALLAELGYPTEGLASKSWDVFAGPQAPQLDFVFTVCDAANGEACPLWPGGPVRVHWGLEDPAAAPEPQQREVFRSVFNELERRIRLFTALPLERLDPGTVRARLVEIGAHGG